MLDEQREHVVVGGDAQRAEKPGYAVVRHDVVLDRVDAGLLQDRGEALHDLGVAVHERHRDAHPRHHQLDDVLAVIYIYIYIYISS